MAKNTNLHNLTMNEFKYCAAHFKNEPLNKENQ